MASERRGGRAGRQRAEEAALRPLDELREITALFYDLVESTRLVQRLGLEDYREFVAAFHQLAANAVEGQGGSVLETFGDGGIAFFGYPVEIEEAALAAVQAGLKIVAACRGMASKAGTGGLHVRVGVATSDAIVAHGVKGNAAITGMAPTLASRLQALAPADTLAVCGRTRRLARRYFAYHSLGSPALKGFDQPQEVWQVSRRIRGHERFVASASLRSPLIGRRAQLQLAMDRWQEVVRGKGQVLIIQGEAGIGKSRLAHEIFRRIKPERQKLILLQCSPHGVNSSLLPIAQVIQAALPRDPGYENELSLDNVAAFMAGEGVTDQRTVQTIAFAVGAAGRPGGLSAEVGLRRVRERIIWAARQCIDEWIRTGPIVIAVEDLQWIDATSKALVEDLIGFIAARPVLLLLTTRNAFAPAAPAPHVTQIALDRLKAADARAMLARLWPEQDRHGPPASALALLHRRTGGVPLFIEEVCQWLAEAVRGGSVDWRALLPTAPLASLENVLSARLAAMGAAKRLVQAASAIGRRFDADLLRALVPDLSEQQFANTLDQLVDARIFSRGQRARGYAFRHALFQEAGYHMLARRSREALHRRIYQAAAGNAWRHRVGAAALAEHAERGGLIDEAVRDCIEAAKENSARSAMVEARHLLERAIGLLQQLPDEQSRERHELAVLAALGPILTSTQGTKSREACELYERAVEVARRRPLAEQAEWFPLYWGWWYTGADFAVQRTRAQAMMSDLRAVSDPQIQLQTQHCIWAIDFNMGGHDTCIAAVDAGLALYDAGRGRANVSLYGGHDAKVCGLGQKGLSLWFKGRPQSAVRSITESVAWARAIGHVGSMAHALDIAAMLHRYRRDYQSVREMAAAMRALAGKHELPSLHAKALIFEGWCDGNSGQPQRGRRLAEEGFAIQREIGTREDFPVYSEMLAELLTGTGEAGTAAALLGEAIDEAERTGHHYWLPELHCRRAMLAASQADRDTALRSLGEAIRLAVAQAAPGLVLTVYAVALAPGLSPSLPAEVRAMVTSAAASVAPFGEMTALITTIGGPFGQGLAAQ